VLESVKQDKLGGEINGSLGYQC